MQYVDKKRNKTQAKHTTNEKEKERNRSLWDREKKLHTRILAHASCVDSVPRRSLISIEPRYYKKAGEFNEALWTLYIVYIIYMYCIR